MLYKNVKLQNAFIFDINQSSIREMFTAINDKGTGVKITNVSLEPHQFPWDGPLPYEINPLSYERNPFTMPPLSYSYTDPFSRFNRQPIYRIAYVFFDEFGDHKDEIVVTDGDIVLFTGSKLVRLNRNQCNICDANNLVDVVFDIE